MAATTAVNPSALALKPVEATDLEVLTLADRADVERIVAEVTIPGDFQYQIKQKGSKLANGQWAPDTYKVGLTVDAYDYLNRVVGATFFMPEWVHDEQGEPQRNPIHRKDYIYLRYAAVWYNPLGQLVMAVEDVEVDFQMLWMDKRANSYSAELMVDEQTGAPLFGENGNPVIKLTKEDELKALRELTRNRSFGPRYAITVARVRLLKQATGLRSLPIDIVGDYKVKVTGYRDRMTPQKRVETAGGDLHTLYGRPVDIQPLKGEEAEEISKAIGAEADAELEQARATIERAAQDDRAEQGDPGPETPAQG